MMCKNQELGRWIGRVPLLTCIFLGALLGTPQCIHEPFQTIGQLCQTRLMAFAHGALGSLPRCSGLSALCFTAALFRIWCQRKVRLPSHMPHTELCDMCRLMSDWTCTDSCEHFMGNYTDHKRAAASVASIALSHTLRSAVCDSKSLLKHSRSAC